MRKFYIMSFVLLFSVGLMAQQIKKDFKKQTCNISKVNSGSITKQALATYFSADFESGNLTGWTLVDSDGDSHNWVNSQSVAGTSDQLVAHGGSYCAGSASYMNSLSSALTPNNWLITPAINLSSASGTVFLEWYAAPQRQIWPSERYKVLVSTSGTSTTNFTNTLFEEVLTAGGTDGNNYFKRTADLSAFAGQTIYVAFVHYNCTDQFWLSLDDISVYENSTTDIGIASIIAPNNNSGCQLSATEDVTVRLFNFGGSAMTGFPVTYNINGGAPVTETFSASIAPASYYDYTFSQKVDLSVLDYYTVNANVNATGDIDGSNNNKTKYVSSTDAYITVEVQADAATGQSWDVVTTTGDTIFKHGSYPWNADSVYNVCVIDNDCYTFNWHGGTSNVVRLSYKGSQINQTTATGDYTIYSIGSNCPAVDAKLSQLTFPGYATPGSNVNITGTVINIGQSPVTSFDVNYTVDGGTAVGNYSVTGINVTTGNSYNFTHNIPFNETIDALYSIEVTISNVNSGADVNTSNNVLSKNILVTGSMMQRKVVFEQFSTEQCPNCPPVEEYMEPIIDADTNIILITHHSGYYTDSYTIPEDNDMLVFYNDGGSTYAPAGMSDRFYNGQDNDGDGTPEPGPVFWNGDPYGGTSIENRLTDPAFVSVNIGGTYNLTTRQLNVTVSGDFLTDFTGSIGVSLWITEDGLSSTSQAGYTGTWIHRYVCRDAISNEWGTQITTATTAGASYSKTFTYTVNSAWNYNKLYLVAMVNQIDGTNVNNREIHNSNQMQLNTIPTVVASDEIAENDFQIYPNPTTGKVSLTNLKGETVAVYNILGEEIIHQNITNSVATYDLSQYANGTYIIKVNTGNTVITKRIIINK